MAFYKLEVEQKFGQLRFRLYPRGATPGDFGGAATDMPKLIANLGEALAPLDLKDGGDSVLFRNVEYADKTSLVETVRFSKY